MAAIPKETIEMISLANYLSVTRAAGLPDSLAQKTYKDNKESADKLTEFKLKHDIKRGDRAMALIGHNSKDTGGVAGDRLKSFIERIERLSEEKTALQEDIKEVFVELKGVGFDVKTTRKIIALRKMDGQKRNEEAELLELYKVALGMQSEMEV